VSTSLWTVEGMTCSHCVSAVTEEVSALPGVTGVEVDLGTGTLRVDADPQPGPDALAAAIDDAGYTLVTP
jgi:copper chaperone